MKIFVSALLASIILFLSSCQQEPDVILGDVDPGNPSDTTPHITNIFKVVEEYHEDPVPDSSVRIIRRVIANGQKTVVVSEVNSWEPADTLLTVFSYDAQDRLTGIATGLTGSNLNEAKYTFTWTGDRLTKVAIDTFGSFAESYDLSYVASGANTIVTSIKTPSDDLIGPDAIITSKHHVTVNAQFNPVGEQWINYFHTPASSDPEVTVRDTANVIYRYTGGDLSSSESGGVYHYLNAPFFPTTGIRRDTLTDVYSRASGGANIADSLKKIYGLQVYSYVNWGLFDLGYLSAIIYYDEFDKNFFNRPYNSVHRSRRTFIDGVSFPSEDYSDVLYQKIDNMFDAGGRLVKASFYERSSETDILDVVRIYY